MIYAANVLVRKTNLTVTAGYTLVKNLTNVIYAARVLVTKTILTFTAMMV